MTPEQIEALNNACRVSMANSLVASVTQLEMTENHTREIMSSLAQTVATQIRAKLESDTITLDEALNALDKISAIVVRSAETKRKIFNGKEMFAVNPLSAKDQALIEMLKSVDTKEKRAKLEKFLESLDTDEFSE